jgi:hypothetical protein
MRQNCLLVLLLAAGCGAPMKTPDAGKMVDTSCGLDCAVQKPLGLTIDNCFEYSTTSNEELPPALGMRVKPVFELEGGVKSLPVEYLVGGQTKMTDFYGVTDGVLVLLRREFGASNSVSYKNTEGALVGVGLASGSDPVGSTRRTTATADVISPSAARKSESTTLTVTYGEATASERNTALKNYDSAIQLLITEAPDHGSDARRVLVPDVGFILVSTPLAPNATAQPYRLQKVRSVAAAGSTPCSL